VLSVKIKQTEVIIGHRHHWNIQTHDRLANGFVNRKGCEDMYKKQGLELGWNQSQSINKVYSKQLSSVFVFWDHLNMERHIR
jgi:hypothetical protein